MSRQGLRGASEDVWAGGGGASRPFLCGRGCLAPPPPVGFSKHSQKHGEGGDGLVCLELLPRFYPQIEIPFQGLCCPGLRVEHLWLLSPSHSCPRGSGALLPAWRQSPGHPACRSAQHLSEELRWYLGALRFQLLCPLLENVSGPCCSLFSPPQTLGTGPLHPTVAPVRGSQPCAGASGGRGVGGGAQC